MFSIVYYEVLTRVRRHVINEYVMFHKRRTVMKFSIKIARYKRDEVHGSTLVAHIFSDSLLFAPLEKVISIWPFVWRQSLRYEPSSVNPCHIIFLFLFQPPFKCTLMIIQPRKTMTYRIGIGTVTTQ